MKHIFWFILITFLAIPAFAQDEEEGGGPEGGAILGGEGLAAINGSGPKVDPLTDLRGWLAKAAAPPIEKKQERPLRSLYDKQVKEMAKAFEKRFGISLDAALAAQSPSRGRRGGTARTPNPEQAAEIRRLSDQLSDKVIAGLRMDQQSALRKYQSEQLRDKEVSLLKQKMKAAGILLTHEQEAQVDALYARESRLRALAIIEAKGEPYNKTTTLLEKQTTQRVVQLLNQSQKAILSAAVTKSKTP